MLIPNCCPLEIVPPRRHLFAIPNVCRQRQ